MIKERKNVVREWRQKINWFPAELQQIFSTTMTYKELKIQRRRGQGIQTTELLHTETYSSPI
jgi:hypothetical protein